MADELQRVGLVFQADGTVDFKKSLKEVNASIQENRSEFKLAKSTWDDSKESAEKLKETQEYLAKQTKDYTDKVKLLSEELELLEKAEKKDETAIKKKKKQLNEAKTSLNNYEKSLGEVSETLQSGKYKLDEYSKSLKNFGDGADGLSEKVSGVSTAAAGLLTGAAALVPATEEYRKIMASLETSSELAGYTADETRQTYEHLFGVLADDQTAATTTANLQALQLSQEKLTEITNGTIGAWAKYGDSIPIDGLAEGINHTVKLGEVQGTMADVLEWAGVSVDDFNTKLASCSTEEERANLILQEFAEQGLTQAGEKWQENNKNLVEGNTATANLTDATAQLAETISPVITEVTTIVAELLNKFNELPTSVQGVIGIALLLIASLAPVISTVGKVATGIGGITSAISTVSSSTTAVGKLATSVMTSIGKGATTLFGIIGKHPIIAIISAIMAVIILLYNKCEWFRDGVDEIIKNVISFFQNLGVKVGEIKDSVIGKFEEIKTNISEKIETARENISTAIELIRGYLDFGEIKDSVIGKFEEIKSGIKEKIEGARDLVNNAINAIKGFFNFKFQWPDIPMPHFSVSPPGWVVGDLLKGKIPTLGISWYKEGGILTGPTAFGVSGNNILAGGEAGKEAVLPIELLKQYMREENEINNGTLVSAFTEAIKELDIIPEINLYLGDKKLTDIFYEVVMKKINTSQKTARRAIGI